MKANVIKKTDSKLVRLLQQKEEYRPDFKILQDSTPLDNTPISPPKAFLFLNIVCKKFRMKTPKLVFISSTKYKTNGQIFPEVNRIFLIRHSVYSFLKSLSEFISPKDTKRCYNKLVSLWRDKEQDKWSI